MAKARKFEATAPDGSVFKRSSQNREYRFAVAYQCDYDAFMASAKAYKDPNYAYHVGMAAGGYMSRNSRGGQGVWLAPRSEEDRLRSVAEIEGFANEAEYRASKRAAQIASVEAQKAAGWFNQWRCAGWQSRLDLAQKIAAGYRFAAILEAREV